MPTENRSSNTEQMVSVPREWAENYAGLLEERCAYEASERVQALLAQPAAQHPVDVKTVICRDCFTEQIKGVPCKTCADVEAKRAAQPQGETVAWSQIRPAAPDAYWVRGNGLDQDALIQVIDDQGELRCNLHQRTTEADFGYGYAVSDLSEDFEWLGPLYTHPDAGEVERLRGIIRTHEKTVLEQSNHLAYMRAQLAERDALLREALCHAQRIEPMSVSLFNRIDVALSASAEPSMPKYHRSPLGMTEEIRRRLTLIAREAAISSTHRYNYMPTTPKDALLWQPHAWVLAAMRMVELSASAEPSAPSEDDYMPQGIVEAAIHGQLVELPGAPVERDERAAFEEWVSTRKVCTHKGATLKKDRAGNYLDYRINDRWLTWQARAALECKS